MSFSFQYIRTEVKANDKNINYMSKLSKIKSIMNIRRFLKYLILFIYIFTYYKVITIIYIYIEKI
jgi:hypothetical protein